MKTNLALSCRAKVACFDLCNQDVKSLNKEFTKMPLHSDMIQNLQEIKKLWTLGFKKENSISLLLQLGVGKAAKGPSLRKGIGVGGWSRKWQFSLTLCNENLLTQEEGGSKKPQNTPT